MKQVKKAYALNICIFCLEVLSVVWMFSGLRLPGTGDVLSSSRLGIFKYFTVDSNIFMGIVAFIVALELKKLLDGKANALSKKTYLLILMGTAGVTLTMLVTIFYLAPTIPNGWVVCFNNSNFFLHLVNPLLSIIAFVCFEKTNRLSVSDSVWGVLPMGIYAIYYVINAVTHSKDGFVLMGYDVYGFFGFGLMIGICVVVPLMFVITFVISLCLRKFNHLKGEFNENIDNEWDLFALLKSQQGELDAVLMYQKIAEKIDDQEVKDLLLATAADEGRHGAVFYNLTNVVLKPKKAKSILVPCLMVLIGKKKTFEIVASQEYAAENDYDEVVGKYPSALSVQKDEHMHGDRMMYVSKKF